MSSSILIVCLSDTHGLHRDVSVPPGDILVHAGHFTGSNTDPDGLRDFDEWLGELPHRHKIVVPGNHDFAVEAHPIPHSLFTNATLLIDQGLDVLGLKFWGSPRNSAIQRRIRAKLLRRPEEALCGHPGWNTGAHYPWPAIRPA